MGDLDILIKTLNQIINEIGCNPTSGEWENENAITHWNSNVPKVYQCSSHSLIYFLQELSCELLNKEFHERVSLLVSNYGDTDDNISYPRDFINSLFVKIEKN